MIEYMIQKLNELLIKQEFEDRRIGKSAYIKKTQCYKDLINLFKKCLEISSK